MAAPAPARTARRPTSHAAHRTAGCGRPAAGPSPAPAPSGGGWGPRRSGRRAPWRGSPDGARPASAAWTGWRAAPGCGRYAGRWFRPV